MTIFVVASAKGESGKTTIAMNITEFLRAQGKTLLIDTDIKQRGFEWAKLHNKAFDFEHLDVQQDDTYTLDHRIETLQQHFEYIVVDIDGHDSKALRSVLKHADKLIVPISNAPEDLELHAQLLEIAIGIVQYNTKLKVYTLLNRVAESTDMREIKNTQNLLQDLPTTHFLNTILYEDTAFNDAMATGKSIWEQSAKASAQFDQMMFELLKH